MQVMLVGKCRVGLQAKAEGSRDVNNYRLEVPRRSLKPEDSEQVDFDVTVTLTVLAVSACDQTCFAFVGVSHVMTMSMAYGVCAF